jgi:hypothetical protein
MTHAHVHRAIGSDLLGFQPEGRQLLLHLVSQDVQLLLLGLDWGLIRLLHLPQSRQLRMLNHHLLSLTGGVGRDLFLEVEKLPAWSRVRFIIPGPRPIALPMGCAQMDAAKTRLNARAKGGIKPRPALGED